MFYLFFEEFIIAKIVLITSILCIRVFKHMNTYIYIYIQTKKGLC